MDKTIPDNNWDLRIRKCEGKEIEEKGKSDEMT